MREGPEDLRVKLTTHFAKGRVKDKEILDNAMEVLEEIVEARRNM